MGKDVTIIATDEQVTIYLQGTLLEVHDRIKDPNKSKSTKSHHIGPWYRALNDDSQYLKRAELIGPSVKELVALILARGDGFIDFRRIWGILNLDKTYSREAIDEACTRAIENGEIGYRYVIRYLAAKGVSVRVEGEALDSSFARVTTKPKYARNPSEYARHVKLVVNNDNNED